MARIAPSVVILSIILLVCGAVFGLRKLWVSKSRTRKILHHQFPLSSVARHHADFSNHSHDHSSSLPASGNGKQGHQGPHGQHENQQKGGKSPVDTKGHEQQDQSAQHWKGQAQGDQGHLNKQTDGQHPVSAIAAAQLGPLSSGQEQQQSADNDSMTRTCYTNVHSHAGLCVHVPLCIERTAFTSFADVLRCAPFTNGQGRESTMSGDSCVDLEHRHESASMLYPLERRPMSWIESSSASIEWWTTTGDAIFLRLAARAVSVPFFTSRVLMLHHVLRHARTRYGLPNVKVVIISAHATVSRKIRYSKSWHHGLLNAAVYPSTPVHSRAAAHRQLHSIEEQQQSTIFDNQNGKGDIVVYVTDGEWDVLPPHGKISTACMRRVAIIASPATSEPKLFLRDWEYPGVSVAMPTSLSVRMDSPQSIAMKKEDEYADAIKFRQNVFSSLNFIPSPISIPSFPRLSNRIIYLHRANTRTFSPASLTRFQTTVTSCTQNRLQYKLIDVSGMTFPEQVKAVAGAAIVVGVHGTQMLNMFFLDRGAAVIELFPYRFSNDLIAHASAGPHMYQAYTMQTGTDFPGLSSYRGDANACRHNSPDCRKWYQSDDRFMEFDQSDEKAFGALLNQAVEHVTPAVQN